VKPLVSIVRPAGIYYGNLDPAPPTRAASFNAGLCGGGVRLAPETIGSTPRRINP